MWALFNLLSFLNGKWNQRSWLKIEILQGKYLAFLSFAVIKFALDRGQIFLRTVEPFTSENISQNSGIHAWPSVVGRHHHSDKYDENNAFCLRRILNAKSLNQFVVWLTQLVHFFLFIFFRWSYHELVLLTQANTFRPGLCYKCSLCKSFYVLKRQYLTAWIFGTGCTRRKGVIALLQANNYRLDLSVRVKPLSVCQTLWKCLKVF